MQSTVTSNAQAAPETAYAITGHSVEQGIVMYHVEFEGQTVKKRFNDFKDFHRRMSAEVEDLPAMPPAGVATVFKRQNEQLIKERSERFQDMLNAAGAHAATFVTIAEETPAVTVGETACAADVKADEKSSEKAEEAAAPVAA